MVTMDSAARAIDAMLHRGRAEERDGGVWLDDLAAGEIGGCTLDEYGTPWREAAIEWERLHDEVETSRDAIIGDRELMADALADIERVIDVARKQGVLTEKNNDAAVALRQIVEVLDTWVEER
jgi:hypothetical protein